MYICFYMENCYNFVVFKIVKDIVFIGEFRRGGGVGGLNFFFFYFEYMNCYKIFYIYLKVIFLFIIILYKCFKKFFYLKKVV